MKLGGIFRWWRNPPVEAFGAAPAGSVVLNSKPEPQVRNLYETLAAFRFFAFAIGLGLFFVPKAGSVGLSDFLFIVGLAGIFNVSRILLPPYARWRSPVVEAAVLVAEALLAAFLVLRSGGLDSPFLVYSFVPILSASLFMEFKVSVAIAVLLVSGVVGAHTAAFFGLNAFPELLESNYLVFAILYMSGVALVALLPFSVNLNRLARLRSVAERKEREALRREVHDEVAQTLAFLSLKLKRAEERHLEKGSLTARDIDDVSRGVERCYLSLRDYLDRTEETLAKPLESMLSDIVKESRLDTGLRIKYSMSGAPRALPPKMARHLVQIVRESLANAAKHAVASKVEMKLEWSPQGVVVRVRDDGRGFSPTAPRGHGISIMEERAKLIGATMHILSIPGEGTELVLTCPLGAGGMA